MKNLIRIFTHASIRYQLIIGIGLLLTALIISFTYLTTTSQGDFLHEQGLSQAKKRSMMLGANARVWVTSNDYVGLEEVVENFKIHNDLIFGAIINMDGKVIAHTDRSLIGKYVSDEERISFLKNIMGPHSIHEREGNIFSNNDKYIDAFQIMHEGDTHIGFVHVRQDQSVRQESINSIMRQGVVFTIISLAIGVFLAYLTANRLTNSLSKLISTMEQIRNGKNIRADESGSKEVHQLSKEFNLMLDTIAKGQAEIKELNSLMSDIINSTDNLLFVKDREYKYIECNKAFQKFIGKSKNEIIGKSDYELFDKEIADFFRDKDKEMFSSGKTEQNYEWVKYPDGADVYLITIKSPLFNLQGEVLGLVGNSMDLTKEKKLEEELFKKEEIMLAQSRHAAMGEMISMIAHQWRQPISVISMSANNILADIELETIDENILRDTSRNIINLTQELSKTIDDFKNFFRPNRLPEEIFVADVVNEALGVIGKSLENNNIEIILEIDEKIKIFTFSRELMQVLINIVKNAKEALLENKIQNSKISVSVKEKNNHHVDLSVCDNAGGINSEIMKEIFNPYFTTKSKINGTGLGLYMSRTIVEKHLQGSIDVKNVDEGACFTITIPNSIVAKEKQNA